MASEVRHIFFEEHELIRALMKYSLIKRTPIEFKQIKSVIINNTGTVSATMMVKKVSNELPVKIDYTTAELAAALVLFCTDTGIILPRRASKILNVDEDLLHMTLIVKDKREYGDAKIERLIKKYSRGGGVKV
ncbi:hypothetical protein [Emcibacter sp.]|uniref:hypothetical protein n=1 Tax=Emcibacter sp. TaxID=1979954 RepID=UPI003A8FF054